ncbi:flagellar basal body P-ring protein FlgI [Botrimarina sp.]|uniref:flagellar basal body P-ring protein FlgI n=1 Tax=Botrimarina sp. TaxID=2795802 RepID=UPI0032EECF28
MSRTKHTTRALLAIATLLGGGESACLAAGSTRLANICRIKGQEENTLRGIGLVVGLNGTGATNDLATQRALSTMLDLMGNPVSATGRFDQQAQLALRNVKNATLVMVTATVPASGARSGDKLDCNVVAIQGKSLEGGRLVAARLRGPNPADPTPYALCEGPLQVNNPATPTTAYVHAGCQMIVDVKTPYVSEDGWVTFVLRPHHADFLRAEQVAYALVQKYVARDFGDGEELEEGAIREKYVQVLNAGNIRVKVPPNLTNDPVAFIAELLELPIYDTDTEARVVCNRQTGSIVIDGAVEIGDVVFTHKNLVIDTGVVAEFKPISQAETSRPRLERLVNALSTLRVPPEDVIEIIRMIEVAGKLHADLIIL